jgi:hypothetical protein
VAQDVFDELVKRGAQVRQAEQGARPFQRVESSLPVSCLGDPVGVEQQPVPWLERNRAYLTCFLEEGREAERQARRGRLGRGDLAVADQQRRRVAAVEDLGPGPARTSTRATPPITAKGSAARKTPCASGEVTGTLPAGLRRARANLAVTPPPCP